MSRREHALLWLDGTLRQIPDRLPGGEAERLLSDACASILLRPAGDADREALIEALESWLLGSDDNKMSFAVHVAGAHKLRELVPAMERLVPLIHAREPRTRWEADVVLRVLDEIRRAD